MTARSLFFTAPGQVEVVEDTIPPPAKNEVLVSSRCSAVSGGTEMLVYRGEFPAGISLDARFEGMDSPPQYPLKYGYCAAGEVIACGSSGLQGWMGKRVFAFHPHASHFAVRPDDTITLPDELSFEDALFLANVETAAGFLMDGRPIVGERVLVLGAGVVGQLTTALLARMPLETLVVCDAIDRRRTWARSFGAHSTLTPQMLSGIDALDCDLVYELSGNPEALDLAIQHTGYNGRIIVGSWYGSKSAPVYLGGRFHRSKISIYGSQVSAIDPRWSGRWNKKRRMEYALETISSIRPSRLISHAYSIDRAPHAYAAMSRSTFDGMQVIFTFPKEKPNLGN